MEVGFLFEWVHLAVGKTKLLCSMWRRESLWGEIGENSNRTVFASCRGQKVQMLPAAVSCSPWKADGFLWVNQMRPSTPSTIQPLACKSSLKICQSVQLNQAAALLTGSAMCCWLKSKPCKATKCVVGHEKAVCYVCFLLFVAVIC